MPVSTRRQLTTQSQLTTRPSKGKRTERCLAPASADDDSSSKAKKLRKEEGLVVPNTPISSKSTITKAIVTPSTPRRRKLVIEPGSVVPPKDWEKVYSLVEELRFDRSAPVDTNGSEALPQRDLGEKVFRFQVLIALMLSSQTKDLVVGDTMRALQQHGLTVDNISATSADRLNQIINKVGFHNNKTKFIKQVVEILKENYAGDIPASAEEMMKLPGVGPKMAFIVENVAWGKSSGIGVDTHMHRIFNELKWVKASNPEQTRVQLESWLPREKWETITVLWVGFGQEVQQFKPKLLEKALNCSRPMEALRLIQRCGLDFKKEAIKTGLGDKLQLVMDSSKTLIED